jgi:hypothetical protein
MIQEEASLPLPEGVHNCLDDVTPSTLAEVGHAFDELHCHGHLTPPESFGDYIG